MILSVNISDSLQSITSAVIVAFILWMARMIYSWKKESQRREKIKEWRMIRYFRKTDAMLYALAMASDKVTSETFNKAYEKKMADFEKEDALEDDEKDKVK